MGVRGRLDGTEDRVEDVAEPEGAVEGRDWMEEAGVAR